MSEKKYVSLSKLSTFLDNLKNNFSGLGHKHTTSDLTDYTVDTELSSTSTNPVANSTLDAEFEAVATGMAALESTINDKSTVNVDDTFMSTLNIYDVTKEEYEAMEAAGTLDSSAIYLTPDEEIDLSGYATVDDLAGKADVGHTHSLEDADDYSDFNEALTAAFATKSDTDHTHEISDVTDLESTLAGKASAEHGHEIADVDGLEDALNGKASSEHTHEIADVTDLQTSLDSKSAVKIDSETVSTFNVYKVTQAEYDQAVADGTLDYDALYLTPDEGVDLSNYATLDDLSGKADTDHTHEIADVNGLDEALAGKSDTGHTHSTEDLTDFGEFTNELIAVLATKSDTDHTHAISDVTDLETTLNVKSTVNVDDTFMSTLNIYDVTKEEYEAMEAAGTLDSNAIYLTPDEEVDLSGYATTADLAGKADSTHSHEISDVNGLQDVLDSMGTAEHTHEISDVNGLQDALDGKSDTGHTHEISDVTDLQSNLDSKSSVKIDSTTVSTFNVYKLTQDEYDQAVADGTLDYDALYLTPDEGVDLSGYVDLTSEQTITAKKTFSSEISVSGNLHLNDVVGMSGRYNSEDSCAVIVLDSSDGEAKIANVASPEDDNDVSNKIYTDTAAEKAATKYFGKVLETVRVTQATASETETVNLVKTYAVVAKCPDLYELGLARVSGLDENGNVDPNSTWLLYPHIIDKALEESNMAEKAMDVLNYEYVIADYGILMDCETDVLYVVAKLDEDGHPLAPETSGVVPQVIFSPNGGTIDGITIPAGILFPTDEAYADLYFEYDIYSKLPQKMLPDTLTTACNNYADTAATKYFGKALETIRVTQKTASTTELAQLTTTYAVVAECPDLYELGLSRIPGFNDDGTIDLSTTWTIYPHVIDATFIASTTVEKSMDSVNYDGIIVDYGAREGYETDVLYALYILDDDGHIPTNDESDLLYPVIFSPNGGTIDGITIPAGILFPTDEAYADLYFEYDIYSKLPQKMLPDNIATTAEIAKLYGGKIGKAGEGNGSEIFNYYTNNTASGAYSHAEGMNTTASGDNSHAEGMLTTANGHCSHAEGRNTKASGVSSHIAVTTDTTLAGAYTHAEGYGTLAYGACSHAEGNGTTAEGNYSHSEGYYTKAVGDNSHAAGLGTIANKYQYVVGRYNTDTTAPTSVSDTNQDAGLFIVGIGSGTSGDESERENGFRVTPGGKVYGTGTFGTSGADYAEYFEWSDGNPDDEDRRGRFVTLDGNKIRYAIPEDSYILGIVSAEPAIAADVHSESWGDKYLRDVFGSKVVEVVEVEETVDENGVVTPAYIERRWVLNPDYNPEANYISRESRPEWDAVGVVGKLVAVDDGTCQINGYCYAGVDGIATSSSERTDYRVIERIDNTHIRIFIK